MDEERLRARLARLAGQTPPPGESAPVLRRARTRLVRNSVVAAALAGIVATGAVSLSGVLDDRNVAAPSGKPVEVSAVSASIKCTARFPSDVVVPGRATGVTFIVENLGENDFRYTTESGGRLGVMDEAGTSLWPGPAVPAPGPMPQALLLKSKAHAKLSAADPIVSWAGPLTIVPACHGVGEIELKPVRFQVVARGDPPAARDAVERAIAETGGLFDECRPNTDGTWTTGIVRPPVTAEPPPRPASLPDTKASPMSVRCAARMERAKGFWIVELIVVSPDSAPEVPLKRTGVVDQLPGEAPMLLARYEFVVTAAGAFNDRQGRSASRTTPDPQDRAIFRVHFAYDGKRWTSGGAARCGSQGFSTWGGGVGIDFINSCQSPNNAYSNQDYGYALQYPADFLREEVPARKDFYKGELHVMRFFDKKFKGQYPDGQILLNLYLKDRPALDRWITAHSGKEGGPEDHNVYFRDIRNVKRIQGPQGRTAFSFDWITSEDGEGRSTYHSVAFHSRDKVALLSWYVHNQDYAATLEPNFQQMLAGWRSEK
jgi:hypothetical protein